MPNPRFKPKKTRKFDGKRYSYKDWCVSSLKREQVKRYKKKGLLVRAVKIPKPYSSTRMSYTPVTAIYVRRKR